MKRVARLAGIILLFPYLALSIIAGIMLAESTLHPARRPLDPAYRAQSVARAHEMGAKLLDVEIQAADGIPLRGWLVRPVQGNNSAVILLHGVADNRLGTAGYAEFLLRYGYTILMPDTRAHGDSGGDLATYGLLEAEDVHRWVGWLEQQEQPRCVFGLGESMGAAILLQALRIEPRFCAVVAESPFADFRHAAYDRLGERFSAGPWLGMTLLRPTVEAGLLYSRLRYGVALGRVSPEDAVATSSVPVLLIHGERDVTLRPYQSRRLHQVNPKTTAIWEVPNVGHCGGLGAPDGEFEHRVVAWLETH
jgi:pimeloyl-ACP methyl ester carboxylesterase